MKDTTGAMLPGVTVEASSPALIEKVRTVVTDSQGQYKIVDLRPGTNTVTFTLTGFTTVKREGIVTTGFTATTDAELRMGSLAETIVVSGASPVVDSQNVRSQNLLSRKGLDTLPTAKTIESYTQITLGATSVGANAGIPQDVGGFKGEASVSMQITDPRESVAIRKGKWTACPRTEASARRPAPGRSRLQGMLDVYNLFSASPITQVNTRYGADWLRPTQILPARLFKVGAQLNF